MQSNETETVVTSQEKPAASATEVENTEASEVSEELEAQSDEQHKESDVKDDKANGSAAEKRIKKLLKKHSDAKAETEYWKSLVLKQNQNPVKQESESTKPAAATKEGKPDPNTFEGTHAEYLEAVADWKAEQKIKAWEQEKANKEKAEKVKSEFDSKIKSFQSKVSEFQKNHDDFEDVLESVDDVPMSIGVHQALLESDIGPEVMYELAKNRKEYERINSLTPIAAAREIGKIEARLSKDLSAEDEQQPQTKKTTQAPKPLNPVGKGAAKAMAKSIDDPDLSFAEYVRLRREQQKRRG